MLTPSLPPRTTSIRNAVFEAPDESGLSVSVPTTYSLFTGTVVPTNDIGNNGDWYNYIGSGVVRTYRKITGLWTVVNTLSGGGGGGGTGDGDALTTDPLSQFAATTSAQLAGVITDETGSGKLVFGTSPTIGTPAITGGTVAGSAISGGTITGTAITGVASPVLGSDAANKSYVDASAAGLFTKTPCNVATVGTNITLAGGAPSVLDGVSLSLDDRILVKDQTDDKQNGIYYVSTLGSGSNGTWTRATDADTGAELSTGSYVFVMFGDDNAQSAYTMTTTGVITIGVSSIVWTLFSQISGGGTGDSIYVEYSIDGATSWHSIFTPTDIYMRQKVGLGGTWSLAMKIVAVDGVNGTNGTNGINGTNGTNGIPGLDGSTTFYSGQFSVPNALRAGDVWFVTDLAFEMRRAAAPGQFNWVSALTGAAAFEIIGGVTYIKRAAIREVDAGVIIAGNITVALSLTSAGKIQSGTGTAAVVMDANGLSAGGGRINLYGDGTNPWIRAYGVSSYSSHIAEINGGSSFVPPHVTVSGGTNLTIIAEASYAMSTSGNSVNINASGITSTGTSTGIYQSGTASVINAGAGATVTGTGGGGIVLFGGHANTLNIITGEDVSSGGTPSGYLKLQVNGRSVWVAFED